MRYIELVNKSIVKSSGIKEADEAILKSIDAGAPYPQFPKEINDDATINIQYTFDYPDMSTYETYSKYNDEDFCQSWDCKFKP